MSTITLDYKPGRPVTVGIGRSATRRRESWEPSLNEDMKDTLHALEVWNAFEPDWEKLRADRQLMWGDKLLIEWENGESDACLLISLPGHDDGDPHHTGVVWNHDGASTHTVPLVALLASESVNEVTLL